MATVGTSVACCATPLAARLLDEHEAGTTADLFKALPDPLAASSTRWRRALSRHAPAVRARARAVAAEGESSPGRSRILVCR